MVSKLALGAIWGYQRYISPHKGFRCAHSVLHGGTGCSGFAKHAIRDAGLWGAFPAIRQRFRDCRTASETLRANCAVHANWAEEQSGKAKRRRRRKRKDGEGWFGTACDCGDFAFCGLALPAFCVAGSAADAQPTPDKMGIPVEGAADGCSGLDCSAPSCDGGCGGCDCSPSCG